MLKNKQYLSVGSGDKRGVYFQGESKRTGLSKQSGTF
jgi:hypothetical protein